MTGADAGTDTVDLVLFEVGGARFGADLTQVQRIDSAGVPRASQNPLGRLTQGHRVLVSQLPSGDERRLAIDSVLGVVRVGVSELRCLPRTVAGPASSIGAWLNGNDTVLLIDLHILDAR